MQQQIHLIFLINSETNVKIQATNIAWQFGTPPQNNGV